MSYRSVSFGIVDGGCQPSEYRTVLVDNRGGQVGLGPCVTECAGYQVVTESGKECHVLQGAVIEETRSPEEPTWMPLILAGAVALAVVLVVR